MIRFYVCNSICFVYLERIHERVLRKVNLIQVSVGENIVNTKYKLEHKLKSLILICFLL